MAWVQTVAEEAASGKLHEVYQRVRERAGVVPNIAKCAVATPEHDGASDSTSTAKSWMTPPASASESGC